MFTVVKVKECGIYRGGVLTSTTERSRRSSRRMYRWWCGRVGGGNKTPPKEHVVESTVPVSRRTSGTIESWFTPGRTPLRIKDGQLFLSVLFHRTLRNGILLGARPNSSPPRTPPLICLLGSSVSFTLRTRTRFQSRSLLLSRQSPRSPPPLRGPLLPVTLSSTLGSLSMDTLSVLLLLRLSSHLSLVTWTPVPFTLGLPPRAGTGPFS